MLQWIGVFAERDAALVYGPDGPGAEGILQQQLAGHSTVGRTVRVQAEDAPRALDALLHAHFQIAQADTKGR